MRTHRTMALAASLSVAAVAAITDVPDAVPAHADVDANTSADASSVRPSPDALAILRSCESGGDYTADNGDGFYGAYQFMLGTWQSLGYGGYPNEAAPEVQDEAVARLYARSGWAPWPGCAEKHDLGSMGTVSGEPLAPVATVSVSTMVVVADVPEVPEAAPAPVVDNRPPHSRFNQLVAEFG